VILASALVVLLALLLLSIPVAAVLAVLGLTLNMFFSPLPLHRALGEISWGTSTDFLLVAIPLFVLLGEILLRAGIAERTYSALDKWLSWLPGGLMHANIATSAMFAATSGSSVATAATISTVALPQARRHGYGEGLFSGSIAAGGTLGILIPPSINLLVYGFLANTSIPQLFMAGIVPGVLLALLFMSVIAVACTVRPSLGSDRRHATWKERFRALLQLSPVLFIFFIVIGSIYAGFATPTESAALGVLAALLLAALNRTLTLRMLRESAEGTMRTTAMIMLILLAAYFLNFVLAAVGLTDQLNAFVNNLGLSALQTLLVIVGLYVMLGFFVETLSLMVITIPIVVPVISGLGYDLVWFGILLILLVEMALITPPVGLNLYVVQGVRRRGSITHVMLGSLPFVLMMFVMIALLIIFPQLALALAHVVG
jgi:C4-dicarboxylate transporter DctM subunit